MKKRPLSITIICWYFIISLPLGCIQLIGLARDQRAQKVMSKLLVPANIHYSIIFFGSLVTFISVIAMFKGKNWGRMLFISWSVIGIIYTFFSNPVRISIIPGLFMLIVMMFFLFRPKANDYFRSGEILNVEKNN